jgi:hypothetical protein
MAGRAKGRIPLFVPLRLWVGENPVAAGFDPLRELARALRLDRGLNVL